MDNKREVSLLKYDGTAQKEHADWTYDPDSQRLIITRSEYTQGRYVIKAGP